MQSSYTFIKRLSIMCTLDDLLSIQHKHFSIISCPLLVHHDAFYVHLKHSSVMYFLFYQNYFTRRYHCIHCSGRDVGAATGCTKDVDSLSRE